MDVSLPLAANPAALFGALFASLVIFDLWLVRWWQLGRIGWKRVDYLWLFAAILGLFAASSEVRRMLAPNFGAFARLYQQARYEDLQREVRFFGSGAICGLFNSPSQVGADDEQRQLDAVCEFGKTAVAALPPEVTSEPLDLTPLRTRPQVQDAFLLHEYSVLDRAIAGYVEAEDKTSALVAASERSSFEIILAVVSPWILTVALALRITKVTGELRLRADDGG
jgi:hypothetical protein